MFTCFNRIHERDGRTDRWMDGHRTHDGIIRTFHTYATALCGDVLN